LAQPQNPSHYCIFNHPKQPTVLTNSGNGNFDLPLRGYIRVNMMVVADWLLVLGSVRVFPGFLVPDRPCDAIKGYRPTSQIRLGLFWRLKSDLIYCQARLLSDLILDLMLF
jgi:hypothetical protein